MDDMGAEKTLSSSRRFKLLHRDWLGDIYVIFNNSVSNEHVIAGLRMPGQRDNRVLPWVRLISTICDEVSKIKPYSSATNLRIGTEEGYHWDEFYAHVSEDIEGSIEHAVVVCRGLCISRPRNNCQRNQS